MDAHLIDSEIYRHLWSTDVSHGVFGEQARVQRWIHILGCLAQAQASLGIIPQASADAVSQLTGQQVDLAAVAAGTRRTSHSTLGLIHVLQEMLPDSARQHVYYGTTVQDITDTSLALEAKEIGEAVWHDLWAIEGDLLRLADLHREAPMSGRTHGQPGSPISFGFKAATWADEIGRHLERLRVSLHAISTAQLGGAVGSLGFFGTDALALRSEFSHRLDLHEPNISWLTSRDRLADFANVLALACGGLARIANEVFNLQRQEIGEVLEATNPSTVGSITMPHKRNPEASEQVVALARLVRSQASLLTETMVQEHERDARGWKVEWVAFPALCHYTTAATSLARSLVTGLEVDADTMLSNLVSAGSTGSERLLSYLSERIGKHQAQDLLQTVYRDARESGSPLAALLADHLGPDELAEILNVDVGASAQMVDAVIHAAQERRASGDSPWG